jgi:hypothetical protein
MGKMHVSVSEFKALLVTRCSILALERWMAREMVSNALNGPAAIFIFSNYMYYGITWELC